MKKINQIAIVGFTLFLLGACNPLDKMQQELESKKEDLAELKKDPEEWRAFIEDDLGAKKTELSKMSKQIKDLSTLIDSLEGESQIDYQIVSGTKIFPEKFESFVKVHGVVATDKNITVVPEGTGIIRSILVKRGSKVRTGQVLAYLDADIIAKNLKEAEANLPYVTTLYEKQKKLYELNVGTEVQYLEAKNRKESLENSIQTLKTQKAKNTIVSPISGEIDEIFAHVGEMASQQIAFARIVNTNNVYVEADVSEAFVGKVNIGDSVFVKFPYSEEEVGAKVSYKSNFINPNNRTFKVHIVLGKTKEQLVPNMLTIVKIRNVNHPVALVVNNTSINTDFTGDFVYVLVPEGKNYKTVKVPVERGETYQNRTVIKSGLKPNDLLVTERYQSLENGDVVELKSK